MKPNRIPTFDPRAKLVFLGAVGVQSFLTDSWVAVGVSLFVIAGTVLITGIPVKNMMIRLKRIFWFLTFIVLINFFTEGGHVLFRLGELSGTLEGSTTGLRLSGNLVVLLWASYLLLETTPPEEIVDALRVWMSPFHKTLGTLVLMITLAVNLAPVLVVHANQLGFSFKARGFDTGSTVRTRIRFLTMATPRVFSSALRVIPQMANAMEARCYNPSQTRTMYPSLRFTLPDWALTGLGGGMIAFSLFLIR